MMADPTMSMDQLKAELESFGETTHKLNEKNKIIYIKKLNHLIARKKNEEKQEIMQNKKKKLQKKILNESDYEPAIVTEEKHLRRRTINISLPSLEPQDPKPKNQSKHKRIETNEKTYISNLNKIPEKQYLNIPLYRLREDPKPKPYFEPKLESPPKQPAATPHKNNNLSPRPLAEFSDSEDESIFITSQAVNTSLPYDSSLNNSSPSLYPPLPRRNAYNPPNSNYTMNYHMKPKIVEPDQNSHLFSRIISFSLIFLFLTIAVVYFYKAFFYPIHHDLIESQICMKILDKSEVCLNSQEKVALNHLILQLAYKAGETMCQGNQQKRDWGGLRVDEEEEGNVEKGMEWSYMTPSELKETLKQKDLHFDMQSFIKLIQANPEWNISMGCKQSIESLNKKLIFGEKCQTFPAENIIYLSSLQPYLSFSCRIKRALRLITWRAALLLISLVSISVIIYLLYLWKKKMDMNKRQIVSMANQISSLLSNHRIQCAKDSSLRDYLPIHHVRDALIPLADRKKMMHIWKRAVDYLRESESRLQQDSIYINGEKSVVWRWVGDDFLAFNNYKKKEEEEEKKKEKEEVEEESEEEVQPIKRQINQSNNIESKYAPLPNPAASGYLNNHKRNQMAFFYADKMITSCFKLFNVLSHENLERNEIPMELRDAILDKCGQYHGILHIGCDHKYEPGVVFVMCISESAASQNYKALHGWVLNDRLISVKYLSPVVYRMIFEESSYAMVPLKSARYRRTPLR